MPSAPEPFQIHADDDSGSSSAPAASDGGTDAAAESPSTPSSLVPQPGDSNGQVVGSTARSPQPDSTPTVTKSSTSVSMPPQTSTTAIVIASLVIMVLGLGLNNPWLALAGAGAALLLSLKVIWTVAAPVLVDLISARQRSLTVAILGTVAAVLGILSATGLLNVFLRWFQALNWDAVGALGEIFGAIGQILIAILAVYIAWRQYVISKDLTIQQNLITQQQTIDSYFQGISELVLDAEGLLEDWPQERAIAEGRTAAILSSVDAGGKAKIIRFLSRSRLLTPLKRDRHLGRAMLDGMGGYQEDRDYGIRVIDLGVMLAAANLAKTDLRWTDLSDANLVRSNLQGCDLVKANLARSILYETNLRGADLMGTRLHYGSVKTATPRTRADIPNYETGAFTGAVVENADLTGVQRLSEEQRYYMCAWGGSKTRATVPGGCEGTPNLLGR